MLRKKKIFFKFTFQIKQQRIQQREATARDPRKGKIANAAAARKVNWVLMVDREAVSRVKQKPD